MWPENVENAGKWCGYFKDSMNMKFQNTNFSFTVFANQ